MSRSRVDADSLEFIQGGGNKRGASSYPPLSRFMPNRGGGEIWEPILFSHTQAHTGCFNKN